MTYRIPERSLKGLCDLILGEYLGGGVGRQVYECKLNEAWVVKLEEDPLGTTHHSFQNVHEYTTWGQVKGWKEYAKWLAPCHFITPCGTALIMSKVEPFPENFKFPRALPEWINTDTKRANYGLLEGRLVACDYGRVNIDYPDKREPVEWWDERSR